MAIHQHRRPAAWIITPPKRRAEIQRLIDALMQPMRDPGSRVPTTMTRTAHPGRAHRASRTRWSPDRSPLAMVPRAVTKGLRCGTIGVVLTPGARTARRRHQRHCAAPRDIGDFPERAQAPGRWPQLRETGTRARPVGMASQQQPAGSRRVVSTHVATRVAPLRESVHGRAQDAPAARSSRRPSTWTFSERPVRRLRTPVGDKRSGDAPSPAYGGRCV
jgi:hypothetical protein